MMKNTTPTRTIGTKANPILTETANEVDYTGKKLVALTSDDGPNVNTTPLVLDKLEEYGGAIPTWINFLRKK